MKLQELPSPYRELAEMRRTDESDFLTGIFKWGSTPEGTDFWAKVNIGYLPEIPASSLQELAEWHKSKLPEANPHHCPECNWQCSCSDNPCSCCHETTEITSPTLIGGKTEQEWLYLFAGQAMAKNIDFSEGYAQLLMGSDKPKEWYLEVDWWRQAEAKYMIEQAKALLTQLKKEVENV